jgi:hypothetical protein
MKKKVVGILVCTLLVTITVLPVAGTINNIEIEKESKSNESIDKGWYYYPSYPNYSPSGAPDFDHEQDSWQVIQPGSNGIADSIAVGDDVQFTEYGEPVDPMKPIVITPGPNCALDTTPGGDDYRGYTFCHAVSLSNCLWWLDSRYSKKGTPGDKKDSFPLVENYGGGDDHSAENVPCLVCEVANMLGVTNDIYLNLYTWINDIESWFEDAGLDNGFLIYDYEFPSFNLIADEIMDDKAIVLMIQFGKNIGGECLCVGSHFVSCAGVNKDNLQISLSDPSFDEENPANDDHNDAQYVSHDVYDVEIGSPCPNYPDIKWWLPDYWPSYYWDYSVVTYALVIECINNVPDAPIIDGPTEGVVDTPYTYTLNSVDSDGDDVYFYIKWGDGYDDETSIVPSGTDVTVTHTWKKVKNYTIEITAKDIFNEDSNISSFEVNIPRFRYAKYQINQRMFELFPLIKRFVNLIKLFH